MGISLIEKHQLELHGLELEYQLDCKYCRRATWGMKC